LFYSRTTAGNNKVDSRFKRKLEIGEEAILFAAVAYHYYRPNENSLEQAEKFRQDCKIAKGDFPPVLDIEQLQSQSVDSLKRSA
jgi:lysozyme